jgi:hypothetical protein
MRAVAVAMRHRSVLLLFTALAGAGCAADDAAQSDVGPPRRDVVVLT